MIKPICPNCFWKGRRKSFLSPHGSACDWDTPVTLRGLFLTWSKFCALHSALCSASPRDAVVHAGHAGHAGHAAHAAHARILVIATRLSTTSQGQNCGSRHGQHTDLHSHYFHIKLQTKKRKTFGTSSIALRCRRLASLQSDNRDEGDWHTAGRIGTKPERALTACAQGNQTVTPRDATREGHKGRSCRGRQGA